MTAGKPLYTKAIAGAGPALVFLPGVGGTTRYWESRVAPLARGHRLILVDLLGFGKSPKPWIRYTLDRHVAELRRVLGERESFTLVGHSFGAVAAVAYAARYPEQVEGLVLFSLPCFGGLDQAIRYYRRRGGPDRWLMTNVVLAAVTCVVTRRILGRLMPRLLPDMPREVAEDLVQHTWLSSTSTIWEGVYRHDVAQDADRLPKKLPVLCLHGDRDVTAPLEYVRRLTEGRPQWTLRVLPDVDHHPLLRDASGCIAAIQEFVAPPRLAATTTR
jgi:pimeloyl-ACP methyl ester carboxylesterase